MALKPRLTEHARTAGHVSHDAQVRIDKRVQQILARHERARLATRTAATRAKDGDPPENVLVARGPRPPAGLRRR
jgi:hypothetical protein